MKHAKHCSTCKPRVNLHPPRSIARRIVERLDSQTPKKGARRNKEALALVIGAAIAQEELGAGSGLQALALLTAVRGASAVEEFAATQETEDNASKDA